MTKMYEVIRMARTIDGNLDEEGVAVTLPKNEAIQYAKDWQQRLPFRDLIAVRPTNGRGHRFEVRDGKVVTFDQRGFGV